MIRNSKTKANYMIMSSIILTILTFISIIAVIIVRVKWDGVDFWNNAGLQTSLWLAVTLSFMFVLFSFINGIIIMSKNWENNHLNSIKGVWGFLTIIPLFLIGSAIFGFIAKKDLKNYKAPRPQTRIVKELVYECDDDSCCCGHY